MNFLQGSVFRVGGALVLGVLLVGLAFFWKQQSTAADRAILPALVVARGDVRTVQTVPDSDGDGLPDWEEALRGTDPSTHTTRVTATSTPQSAEEPYTAPTTVTGQFSERFLENILRSGAGRTLTPEEKTALVDQSIGTLAAHVRDTLYTQADIVSVARNDLASVREYGNAVGSAFLEHPIKNESALALFERAIASNEHEGLTVLAPIEQAYAAIIRDLLTLPTPSTLARQHTDLINTLSMVHADIVAMEHAFSDSMNALVRIKRYHDDIAGLAAALDNIRTALEMKQIVYTSTESGIFLFSLRP